MAAAQGKVIITCAITGAIHTPTMSPYLPITPEQIRIALGDEKVKELAEKAGISTQDASEAISRTWKSFAAARRNSSGKPTTGMPFTSR